MAPRVGGRGPPYGCRESQSHRMGRRTANRRARPAHPVTAITAWVVAAVIISLNAWMLWGTFGEWFG